MFNLSNSHISPYFGLLKQTNLLSFKDICNGPCKIFSCLEILLSRYFCYCISFQKSHAIGLNQWFWTTSRTICLKGVSISFKITLVVVLLSHMIAVTVRKHWVRVCFSKLYLIIVKVRIFHIYSLQILHTHR